MTRIMTSEFFARAFAHSCSIISNFSVSVSIRFINIVLFLSEDISGRSGGAARTRMEWRQWHRSAGEPPSLLEVNAGGRPKFSLEWCDNYALARSRHFLRKLPLRRAAMG